MKDIRQINHNNRRCTEALWKRYNDGFIPVIPDIKLKSPGEGELLCGRDPIGYAQALVKAGAPVISVVTEVEHYGGSTELLHNITKAVSVPVLRKDFIKSREQLIESAELGASAVLLIASIMSETELDYLLNEAIALGLEPLVETHAAKEITYAKGLSLTFLGINNRDILNWETDNGNVRNTERLADLAESGIAYKDRGIFLLSESSISSPMEVRRAVEAGAHGVLVGTAILKAIDPVKIFKELSINR